MSSSSLFPFISQIHAVTKQYSVSLTFSTLSFGQPTLDVFIFKAFFFSFTVVLFLFSMGNYDCASDFVTFSWSIHVMILTLSLKLLCYTHSTSCLSNILMLALLLNACAILFFKTQKRNWMLSQHSIFHVALDVKFRNYTTEN